MPLPILESDLGRALMGAPKGIRSLEPVMFAITPGTRTFSGWVGGTRTPIDLVRSQEPIRSATGALEAAQGVEP